MSSTLSPGTRPGHRGALAPLGDDVAVVDTPTTRVRRPVDLVGLVLSLVGIAFVLVLAVYAEGTTTGLTEDVQGVASVVRRILIVPVTVLEALITFVAPLAVLTGLVIRRMAREAIEAIVAAAVGILLAVLATWLIAEFGAGQLAASFSVRTRGSAEVTIGAAFTGTAALLTAAGTRHRRRTVAWSWNLVWLGLGVVLLTGLITLPGVLLTVLVGRATGLATRYVSGVQSERAYGPALVAAVRRAGFDPVELVRVSDVTVDHRSDRYRPDSADVPPSADRRHNPDLGTAALARQGDNRVYAITTDRGERLDVVVLDGDRQVMGLLARTWRSLRLRGLDGRPAVSLRQSAERAALLSYAASSAGVCTPRLLGMAEAEGSMVLVQTHADGAVPLRDLPTERLTDDVLDAVWEQLRLAHAAGLAHRAITADVFLLQTRLRRGEKPACTPPGPHSGAPVVLLIGWDAGDVASSELARRMDVSQLLAVLALKVGAERAVASAARSLGDADLARIGPLLQAIALPRRTREDARRHKGVLAEVREELLTRLPEADVEPERLVRFGARTVLTVVLTVGAAVVVVSYANFADIAAAFADARREPWWVVIAFALGMVTFLGSALALVAFAPVHLPLWRTTLVQAAAAFVSLVAPAGVGPAALNLRMLHRRKVPNALAVASVGLVQVSQFVTTVALLVVLYLLTGSRAPLTLPSATVALAVGIGLAAVASAMLVPRVRQWALARTVPVWRQTWPRLIQLLGQPRRFAVAIGGNLIMTLGYLGAFYACLAAFGERDLSLIDLALIYLVGNASGAVVPTPGGLGAVEVALITGLTLTGDVPPAIATSVVVLFRGLTFWGRIPFGWLAMRSLQRTGEL